MDNEEHCTALRAAVKDGIKEALRDEETVGAFWDSAFKHLQQKAQAGTGRFVLGGLGATLRRVSVFLALGFIVYSVGGWSALGKLFSVLWSSGG